MGNQKFTMSLLNSTIHWGCILTCPRLQSTEYPVHTCDLMARQGVSSELPMLIPNGCSHLPPVVPRLQKVHKDPELTSPAFHVKSKEKWTKPALCFCTHFCTHFLPPVMALQVLQLSSPYTCVQASTWLCHMLERAFIPVCFSPSSSSVLTTEQMDSTVPESILAW